jgi:hypothetical protein
MTMKKLPLAFIFFNCTFSYAQTLPSGKKNDLVFPGSSWEYIKDP